MINPDIKIETYRRKVIGCWLGKVIGGTLGMPYEGQNGPFNLSYYNPVPVKMVENDDLDLQVLWAVLYSKMDLPKVCRKQFVSAWQDNIQFPWDEYSVAKRNIAEGLLPPLTGSYDNWFQDGMGAAIRSELWACLAPGDSVLAARFAFEDGCVDHAENGVFAEMFLAAVESAAFVLNDLQQILEIGLLQIPPRSRIASVVKDIFLWWNQTQDYMAIREKILQRYTPLTFTDSVVNIAFIVLGLLAGQGDFGKSICYAANCGFDTDCTAASVGSILGIMNPDGIEDRWIKPIGSNIVISPTIVNIDAPKTITDFAEMVINLAMRVSLCDCSHNLSQLPDVKKRYIEIEMAECQDDIFGGGYPVPASIPIPAHLDFCKIQVQGTHARLERKIFKCRPMLLKYHFYMSHNQRVRIMFNTQENCRVWLDGEYAFGREYGRMAPSFHRVPINQFKDITLSKGTHELIASVYPVVSDNDIVEWVVGIGDFDSKQWIPNAFDKLCK